MPRNSLCVQSNKILAFKKYKEIVMRKKDTLHLIKAGKELGDLRAEISRTEYLMSTRQWNELIAHAHYIFQKYDIKAQQYRMGPVSGSPYEIGEQCIHFLRSIVLDKSVETAFHLASS